MGYAERASRKRRETEEVLGMKVVKGAQIILVLPERAKIFGMTVFQGKGVVVTSIGVFVQGDNGCFRCIAPNCKG